MRILHANVAGKINYPKKIEIEIINPNNYLI